MVQGENYTKGIMDMGFVHLFSYQYEMYFLNAHINAEFSMHVTNMKHTMNAYHTLVSLLMMRNPNSEYNTRDNIRLYMSMAHITKV